MIQTIYKKLRSLDLDLIKLLLSLFKQVKTRENFIDLKIRFQKY